MDWVGLVKARLQGAIKLLASLLDVVLVEVAHVHPLVRIMAETLALNGLDVLRVAAAGETIAPPLKEENEDREITCLNVLPLFMHCESTFDILSQYHLSCEGSNQRFCMVIQA